MRLRSYFYYDGSRRASKVQLPCEKNNPYQRLKSDQRSRPRLPPREVYPYNGDMRYFIFFLPLVFCLSANANYESYDEIVTKLSSYESVERDPNPAYRSDIRTFSRAHIGLGIAQTFFDADAAALDSSMQNQGGLLINVGVDVLNQHWGLEGSYTNFGTQNTSGSEIKLREFAIKGLYKPSLNKTWSLRLGLGVSSRFLDINNPSTNEAYKTPSGLFLFGVDSYISKFISVGADLNFKTAMIDDTIDKNSVDLAFRVDTHF